MYLRSDRECTFILKSLSIFIPSCHFTNCQGVDTSYIMPCLRGTKLSRRPITRHNGHSKGHSKYITNPELMRAINLKQGSSRLYGYHEDTATKHTDTLYFKIIGRGISQGTKMGERTSDTITLTGLRGLYRVENTSTTMELKFRLFIVEPVRSTESLNNRLFQSTGS